MPFDDRTFPSAEAAKLRRNRAAVACWLFTVAFVIFLMTVLGGATRLTGSGLSIMEWAPLLGTLPPMSDAEWHRLFALYQQTGQYRLVNAGFGLAGFKHIFWLEWAHRLCGRLLGVVFAVPMVALAWRGAIPRRLIPRLTLFFGLGGLQGAVGWLMVKSGFFPDSTAVSPPRLVAHLALALTLYAAILWTALSTLHPIAEPLPAARQTRRLVLAATVLIACTIVAGGFTAGLHAGLTYNTFPLMGGGLVPPGYALPFASGPTDTLASVQFDHRLLATCTALTVLAAVVVGLRAKLGRAGRRAIGLLGAAVVLQYALGVTTLMLVVPVPVAVLHQAGAVLLLTAALYALHALRGASVRFAGPPAPTQKV